MKNRIFALFFLLSAVGLAYVSYIWLENIQTEMRIKEQQQLEVNLAIQAKREKQLAKENAKVKARVEAEQNALVDAAPDNGESKIVNDEPEMQEDAAPEIPKEPIVKVNKKYSDEQIKQAREYVGNYRYIQKEINKQTLRCMSDNNVSGDEALASCTNIAMKRFNMKTDAESKMKLESKYKEQLQIALSK